VMYPQMVQDPELYIEPNTSLLLTQVSHFLTDSGIQSYLTGGFVRDMLLGRATADVDIAVAANALEVAPQIAAALDGKYVLLDEENRVGRVVVSDGGDSTRHKWQLDISSFEDDIEKDLARRDFTIDAMAVDLEEIVHQPRSATIVDPFKGEEDLRQGAIRAVSEKAFPSDPVRLLRAVRLAAELGFSIDSETENQIRRYAHLIADVAGERIREELLRVLAVSGAGQFLMYLDELGILNALVPELAPTKGFEQPKEHFWDVFTHSINTVTAVDFLLKQGNWEYADTEVLRVVPRSNKLEQHFNREVGHGSSRQSLLKMAAFLHDIAKPQTRTIEEDGRMRFFGHDKEGAAVAASILERLRFSAREIKQVETMVRYHLRPTQMSQGEQLPTHRSIYRYFRDTREAGIDILFLSLADHLASRGQHLDLAQWQEHTRLVDYVLNKHFEEEKIVAPPKLIDGHDLINNFKLSPGPKIGEILEAIREAQAAGEVTTRQEAIAYARRLLESTSSK
jgi:poly(A) polymerase